MQKDYKIYNTKWESLPLEANYSLRELPASWIDITPAEFEGRAKLFLKSTKLRVIISIDKKENSDRWLHVSASFRDRIPSWEELKEVKDVFIGPDKAAIQIFPRSSEYVNVHPFVMHLWTNLDNEEYLPDFRREGLV